ncbi:hypothetical protein PFISCL1PPCAC_21406, partial [Pristionchus fissidentatus]
FQMSSHILVFDSWNPKRNEMMSRNCKGGNYEWSVRVLVKGHMSGPYPFSAITYFLHCTPLTASEEHPLVMWSAAIKADVSIKLPGSQHHAVKERLSFSSARPFVKICKHCRSGPSGKVRTLNQEIKSAIVEINVDILDEHFDLPKQMPLTDITEKTEMKDVNITVGGQPFHESRDVLLTFMGYMQGRMSGSFVEGDAKDINLEEFEGQDFEMILRILHRDCSVSDDNAAEILPLVDYLAISTIKNEIDELFCAPDCKVEKGLRAELADHHCLPKTKAHLCAGTSVASEQSTPIATNHSDLTNFNESSDLQNLALVVGGRAFYVSEAAVNISPDRVDPPLRMNNQVMLMVCEGLRDASGTLISLDRIEPDKFLELLRVVYRDHSINDDNIRDILPLVEYLNMPKLKDQIDWHLGESACSIEYGQKLLIADRFNLTRAKNSIVHLLSEEDLLQQFQNNESYWKLSLEMRCLIADVRTADYKAKKALKRKRR